MSTKNTFGTRTAAYNDLIYDLNQLKIFYKPSDINREKGFTEKAAMDIFLLETKLLDYSSKHLQDLTKQRNWNALDEFHKIKEIYNFVRDEIAFGYNVSDAIPASRVLRDGYGQCNTKATLFMALLRGVGVPCRIHGFTIDKKLQKGAMTGIVYKNAPARIFHSWVEVRYQEQWYALEGLILDLPYLRSLQERNADCTGAFCGYGVAVKDLRKPVIDWNGNDTYIQSEGIVEDFGVNINNG